MPNFVSGFKTNPSGEFLTRYASSKKNQNQYNDKAEFEVGYRKGKMRLAVASKFMKLANCGCNRYIENDAPHIVWAKDGDSIIRLEEDLSWVDKLLEGENNAAS